MKRLSILLLPFVFLSSAEARLRLSSADIEEFEANASRMICETELIKDLEPIMGGKFESSSVPDSAKAWKTVEGKYVPQLGKYKMELNQFRKILRFELRITQIATKIAKSSMKQCKVQYSEGYAHRSDSELTLTVREWISHFGGIPK